MSTFGLPVELLKDSGLRQPDEIVASPLRGSSHKKGVRVGRRRRNIRILSNFLIGFSEILYQISYVLYYCKLYGAYPEFLVRCINTGQTDLDRP